MSNSTKYIMFGLSTDTPAQKTVPSKEKSAVEGSVQQPKQVPIRAMTKPALSMAEAVLESLIRKDDPTLTPNSSR